MRDPRGSGDGTGLGTGNAAQAEPERTSILLPDGPGHQDPVTGRAVGSEDMGCLAMRGGAVGTIPGACMVTAWRLRLPRDRATTRMRKPITLHVRC